MNKNCEIKKIEFDDSFYEGEVINDIPNGKGTFIFEGDDDVWTKGDKYFGNWKDSYFHGFGILTLSDGTEYSGEFKDGVQHGYGKITYSDGTTMTGEWVEGDFKG